MSKHLEFGVNQVSVRNINLGHNLPYRDTSSGPTVNITKLFHAHKNDGLVLPEKVAETYLHLVKQHRSTWTHELDVRSFTDIAWWNHKINGFD